MGLFTSHKTQMVTVDPALPGRDEAMPDTASHLVLGTKITPPFPDGLEQAVMAHHQQYLKANPAGYCGLRGTGVSCSVGLAEAG